ncbi:maltokinase N-terminal cap-like domain-containing protein [Actinacidiphila bryophytorum]|uniref:maltokinase N-terminal cap-like domain-containing protein n=1 Tax=Actinacidiphila bryophytorum TaxID=1436133 RepID=UPI002176A5ED|nr:phosphotransferase [Actinacidiphila bryophytorum]UWE09231.1 phosphotransferase [Actinacidiphila bryophytorum]
MTTASDRTACAQDPQSAGAALRAHRLLGPLAPALTPWLLSRRWFPHDDGCGHDLRPVACSVLHEEDGVALVHAIVEDRQAAGRSRRWQLLVGVSRLPPQAPDAEVFGQAEQGAWHGWSLYDATADPHLMTALVRRTLQPRGGEPRLTMAEDFGGGALDGLAPRALLADQSNTNVVFGDRFMFKLIRSPQEGIQPETEILSALTRLPGPNTPRLAGWLHTADGGARPTVLGVLTEFLPNDGDAWRLALTQADRFTLHARSLGVAVATLHTRLAEALGSSPATDGQIRDQTAAMGERLRAALAEVPELAPYESRLTALHKDYGRCAGAAAGDVQRIHGDLHLGQILHTPDGWRFIDFEGEPARPLAERARPEHPLRDVAGMFRSFDYAAAQAVASGPPADAARARTWCAVNQREFARGYTAAGGIDPGLHPVAMRAFEADKAVYEALYEARHRPDWLPIPLAAIERALSGS